MSLRQSRRKPSPWDSATPVRSKRRGTRGTFEETHDVSPPVDVTIIYSSDALEWDTYLTDCLNHFCQKPNDLSINCGDPKQGIPSHQLIINHERLEKIPLIEMPVSRSSALASSKVTLVIISPDFVDFIESHSDVYEVGKLLKPDSTVAMLCGVQEKDIGSVHRAALVSYDGWNRLVAKDQDKDFVMSVVDAIKYLLQNAEETNRLSQKPQFKITPRKVKEGLNKVFVLLDHPMDASHKVQVFLEGESIKEIAVKKRNPYTLQFIVPESYLKVSKLLNIHVRCQGTLLGVHPLKVDSLMGELSTILSSVDSPYELLYRTLGFESRHQIDEFLVDKYNQRLPQGLKVDWLLESVGEKSISESKEELPTILHFAACYGLKFLTQAILSSPGGREACSIRNTRGLTPVHLANYNGYSDIAALLDGRKNKSLKKNKTSIKATKGERSQNSNLSGAIGWSVENKTYVNIPDITDPNEHYDFPSSTPKPVVPPRPSVMPKPQLIKSNHNTIAQEHNPQYLLKDDCTQEEETRIDDNPVREEDEFLPEESMYLTMRAINPGDELLPHQLLLQGQLKLFSCSKESNDEVDDEDDDNANKTKLTEEVDESPKISVAVIPALDTSDFCTNVLETLNEEKPCMNQTQEELIKVLQGIKQGRPISLIQKDFDDWKIRNRLDVETDSSLNELRDKFQKKKMEKGVSNKKKTVFGILDSFLSPKRKASKSPTQPIITKLPPTEINTETNLLASQATGTPLSSQLSASTISLACKMIEFDDDIGDRPISTLSTTSSCNSRASTVSSVSSISLGSVYDSGNHSDSCDEGLLKKNVAQSVINRRPSLQLQSSFRKISLSKRPPAPPPRLTATLILNDTTPANIINSENTESDYEIPIGMNPPRRTNLNNVVPLSSTDKKDEDCYWVPPPPIPLSRRSHSVNEECENIYYEADYDVPRSNNFNTSFDLNYDVPKSDCVRTRPPFKYDIPKSETTESEMDYDVPKTIQHRSGPLTDGYYVYPK